MAPGGRANLRHDATVFILGFCTCLACVQWTRHVEALAYQRGYEARDLEAYSSLHTYHDMTVTAAYTPFEYDVMGKKDGKPTFVRFCERRDFKKGMRFRTLSFYDKGECVSLNGPKVEVDPETKDGKPVIYEVAMKGNL